MKLSFGQLSTLSRILIPIFLNSPTWAIAAPRLCYATSDYQTAEVSKEEINTLQEGALTLTLSKPPGCRLIPGEVYLYELSSKESKTELPILWAKAIYKSDQAPLDVTDVYQGTRLAPTCLGTCSRVSRSFSAKANEQILDQRSNSPPFPMIPNLKTPSDLRQQKTLSSQKSLVFLLNSNRLAEKTNWQSFREFQSKGYDETIWYYPGFEGLTHTVEWSERRNLLPVVTNQNIQGLLKENIRFLFVGKSLSHSSETTNGALPKIESLHPRQNFDFSREEQEKLTTLFSSAPKTSWVLITETDEATRWSDLVFDIFSSLQPIAQSTQANDTSLPTAKSPRLYRWRGNFSLFAPVPNPPAASRVSNESPTCPAEASLVYLRENEMNALTETGQVRLIRNKDGQGTICPTVGQKLLLARYEASLGLGFLFGTAVVFAKESGKRLTLTLGQADLSWRESELLAPYCKDCQIRILSATATAPTITSEPVLDLGPQAFPAVGHGAVLTWRRPLTEIQSLDEIRGRNTNTPNQDSGLALWTSSPVLSLRQLLGQFSQQKKRPWIWYYPDPFWLTRRPPSVPGVVEVTPEWFKELEKEKIHMITLADLPDTIWPGPKTHIQEPPLISFEPENHSQMRRRQELSKTMISLLATLTKTSRPHTPLMVLSKGGFDFASFYLVEGLKQMGYEQIYWLRTSGLNAKRRVSLDIPPQPLYPAKTGNLQQ